MKFDSLENAILSKLGAVKDFPFGPEVLVYKVGGKIFALLSHLETPFQLSLKCDPDDAPVLRSMFNSINPGYHLNKEHWNTITLDDTLPEDLLFKLIDDSYLLVLPNLPKVIRDTLENH